MDYHLHEFRILDVAQRQVVSIGIPTDDNPEDRSVVAGWQTPLSKFFDQRNWSDFPATYAYDFGDDWQHILVHEGLEPVDRNCKYPRCVAGEGRCPPEDCGGVHGYAEVLQVIANPDHEGHASMLEWAGGHFDPHAFDPSAVKFDDPAKRWKKAFGLGRMR